MNVVLPNGKRVTGVPNGISQEELVRLLSNAGHDTSWYKHKDQLAAQNNQMLSDMLQQDVQAHPDKDLAAQNSQMLSSMLQQDVQQNPQPQQFTPPPSQQESFWDRYGKMQAEASDVDVAAQEQMGTQLGLGVISPLKMVASAAGADSWATRKLTSAEQYLQGMLSAADKQDMEEAQKIRQDAQDKGIWDQVKAEWEALKADPQSLVRFGAGAVPFMAAAMAGPEAAAVTGLTAGLGGVKESIFDSVRNEVAQKLVNEGVDQKTAIERATAIADKAQAYNGENLDSIIAGGVLGLVTAGKAGEITDSVITGLTEKGLLRATAESAATLGVFGAQAKEAENLALQRQGFDVSQFRGVPGAFVQGAIPGLGLGLLHGAQEGRPDILENYRAETGFRPEDYRVEPTVEPEQPRQLRGPTDESARADVGVQPPGVDDTGAGVSFPVPSEKGPEERPIGEAEEPTSGGVGVPGGGLRTVGGTEGREPSALDEIKTEIQNVMTEYPELATMSKNNIPALVFTTAQGKEEFELTDEVQNKAANLLTEFKNAGAEQDAFMALHYVTSENVNNMDDYINLMIDRYPDMDEEQAKQLFGNRADEVKARMSGEKPPVSKAPTPEVGAKVVEPEPNDITLDNLLAGASERKADNKTAVDQVAKILNDVNPPEEPAEAIVPGSTIKGKPDVGKKRMAKMLGPQLYGDPTHMATVSAKEILQNSYDAIKDLQNKGLLGKGKIKINTYPSTRTLEMTDNGKGMLPELLSTKFLEIAGTGKQDDPNASGGFGIAKMLFLYANDAIHVITMAKDATGQPIVSEMKTSGEKLFDALENEGDRPDIVTRRPTPEDKRRFPDGSGTHISLQIPKDFLDPQTNKRKDIDFLHDYVAPSEIEHSPLFGDIDVTYNGNDVATGSKFNAEKHQQFANVKFEWGTVRIYVAGEGNGYARVLSNGLYQFQLRVNKPGQPYSYLPYDFYVDVSPKVKPDEPGYPFTLNRKAFTEKAEKEFNKVFKYVQALYGYKDLADEAKDYGSLSYVSKNGKLSKPIELKPTVPPPDTAFSFINKGDKVEVKNGRIYVNGKELPETDIETLMRNIPAATSLKIDPSIIDTSKVMVHDNSKVKYTATAATGDKDISLIKHLQEQFGEERVNKFISITGHAFMELRDKVSALMQYPELGDIGVGVSVAEGYRGVYIHVPFEGMFVNPFAAEARGDTALTGYGIIGTMIHEMAHHKIKDHYESFPQEMQRITAKLENARRNKIFDIAKFKDKFVDNIQQFEDIITYANRLYDDYRIKTSGNELQSAERIGQNIQEESGAGERRTRSVSGRGDEATGLGSLREDTTQGAGPTQAGGTSGPTRKGTKKQRITALQRKIAEAEWGMETAKTVGQLFLEARDYKEKLAVLKALGKNIGADSLHLLLPTLPTDFITDWVGDRIPLIKDVNKLQLNMDSYRWKHVKEVTEVLDNLVKFYNEHGKEGMNALANAMHAATYNEVDPSKFKNEEDAIRRDTEVNKAREKYIDLVTAGKGTPDAKAAGRAKAAITRRESEIREVYQYWNKLGLFDKGKGRELFKTVLDSYEKVYDEMAKLLVDIADYSGLPGSIKDPNSPKGKLKVALQARFLENRKISVYAPLHRSGKNWLILGKGPTIRVYSYYSATARDLAKARWLKERKASGDTRTETELMQAGELGFGDNIRTMRKSYDLTSDQLLKNIFEAIESAAKGPKGASQLIDPEEVMDLVFQMYIRALPGSDIRSRLAKRKKVAGWSNDIINNFASIQGTAINQLARLKYEGRLRTKISEARDYIDSSPDKIWLGKFVDEIAFRVDAELAGTRVKPGQIDWNAVARFGKQMVFYYMLTTPRTALVQLTQLPMVGIPVLNKHYGATATGATVGRYFDLYHKIGMTEVDSAGEKTINISMRNSEYVKGNEVLKHAYDWADNQVNLFNMTNTADLSARSAESSTVMQGRLRRGTRMAMTVMSKALHHTERLSRELMYMASFELAMKKRGLDIKELEGTPELKAALKQLATIDDAFDLDVTTPVALSPLAKSISNAKEEAMNVMWEALYNYSTYNKPRVMTSMGVVPAMASSLMMYPVSTSLILAKNFYRVLPSFKNQFKLEYEKAKEEGLNDDDASDRAYEQAKENSERIRQERKDAAKLFFGMQGMAILFSGISGFFGLSLIFGLLEGLRDKYRDIAGHDKLEDMEENNPLGKVHLKDWFLQYFIPEFFGEGSKLARTAQYGVPSALTGLDFSGSTSYDNMFFSNTPDVDKTREGFALFLYDHGLGAPGQLMLQGLDAYDDFNKGYWDRGAEKLLPGFLRAPTTAMRNLREGEVTEKGRVLKEQEAYTAGQILGRSLGFQVLDVSEIRKQTEYAMKTSKEVTAKHSELYDAMDKVVIDYEKSKNYEAFEKSRDKVLKKMLDYNNTSFGATYPIKTKDMIKAMRDRAKVRKSAISGMPIDDLTKFFNFGKPKGYRE